MAQRSFTNKGWTPTAVGDGAVFTDNGYMALQGGSATQRTIISEIELGGLASVTSPCPMVLAADSVVGVTLTGLASPAADAPIDPATAALAAPPVPFTASTTKPQRDVARALLALGFNAFGSLVRWVAPPGREIVMLGNTAASATVRGEVSLSAFTGGTMGLMTSHIIYEPL